MHVSSALSVRTDLCWCARIEEARRDPAALAIGNRRIAGGQAVFPANPGDTAVAQRMGAAAYARYWAAPPTPAAHAARLSQVYESMLAAARTSARVAGARLGAANGERGRTSLPAVEARVTPEMIPEIQKAVR